MNSKQKEETLANYFLKEFFKSIISEKAKTFPQIKKEIDKCILLCANCHMELHEGITQLPVRKSGRIIR
jgi:hypothetical protein